MSSSKNSVDVIQDISDSVGAKTTKKLRVERACDTCRRKKVRCDGEQIPDDRCSNCVYYKCECTYSESIRKRHPKGYVKSIEERIKKIELLLQKVCPGVDFSQDAGTQLELGKESQNMRLSEALDDLNVSMMPQPLSADEPSLDPSDDETSAREIMLNCFKKAPFTQSHKGFFGKSSHTLLIQNAIKARQEYTGAEMPETKSRINRPLLKAERVQLWGSQPWMMTSLHSESLHLSFPDADLMYSLIHLYFIHSNDYLPLLHRPTFEKHIYYGLHLRDKGFGSTVLLVCAVGSRFSNDPRAFLEGTNSAHSCGWSWFSQVQLARNSFLAPPSLYEVQSYCLAALFLSGTCAPPQARWTIVGVGLRLALNVGAHRRKVYNTISTVEEELWKRVFWILVYLDRTMSLSLGRSCAIQNEDIDVEPLAECDDEYWEVTESKCDFNQPAEKPSKIVYFNCLLRLNQILAFALRTIYSINPSRVLKFLGKQWEQRIVAELDSALNKWIDAVPDHLRWDPNKENDLFLNQSASLYAHYYQLQIAVHRPFIPTPNTPSSLSFPSLAICTNAARSCIHVLNVPFQRNAAVLHANMVALVTCGVVLLLNLWRSKRSGLFIHYGKEMVDIQTCMTMLNFLEDRWPTAGRGWDALSELASVGDLPLPQPTSASPSHKRERDPDGLYFINLTESSTFLESPMITPPTHDVDNNGELGPIVADLTDQRQTSNFNYTLPVYTEELGRLPPLRGSNLNPSNPNDANQQSSSSTSFPIDPHYSEAGGSPELDPFMSSLLSMSPSRFDAAIYSSQAPTYPSAQDSTTALGVPATSPNTGAANDFLFPFPERTLLATWSDSLHNFSWDLNWELSTPNIRETSNASDPAVAPGQDP